MPRITRSEVHRVAKLARLALSDAEADRMTNDLDHILEYVEKLRELDTGDIEPTAHAIPLATPMRPDRAAPGIVVPKVIEGEEEG